MARSHDRPVRIDRSGRAVVVAVFATLVIAGCATSGTRFPWPARGPSIAAIRADVTTVNSSYRRTTSQVLVRRIGHPTRANLDYAAYHANFMNADPPPEGAMASDGGKLPSAIRPFGGALEIDSLTGSISATSLTPDERAHPLSVAPLIELLTSKRVPGADRLEDVTARIRAESWGMAGGPQIVRQLPAEVFIHDPGQGGKMEVWIRVEFAPWFKGFSGMPDEDGDGFPEIFGRVPADALGDAREIVRFIRDEYEGREFSPAEVKGWAHQLASYWYPSYNTDLITAPTGWPADDTEAAIRGELGDLRFAAPTVVMRGKPVGKPVYNVFLIDGTPPATDKSRTTAAALTPIRLPRSTPTPDPLPIVKAVRAELAAHGASWSAWTAEVAPLHEALKSRLAAMPPGAKALAGADGFLFFRQSLAYVLGGDLGKQRRDRNPIPIIAQFKKLLAEHGVDFLFVPVPTKVEIFPDRASMGPDKAAASFARFSGKVANPFERKFLLDLGEKGIETVDLMPAFLADRARTADAGTEPLYQAQDTHWTSRGLELAARIVADRVKRYPWYKELAAHRRAYKTKDASFTRHGDLHSRLPETEKARYAPETLLGHQVVSADGTPYEDDPDSPVVLLGDSFTGVYQLMDCEHAGVSAHLAKEIGTPVDLVMSYGGGPNVRQKLLRRGVESLSSKKLVIWMMTARDLYDFWEGWQPMGKK